VGNSAALSQNAGAGRSSRPSRSHPTAQKTRGGDPVRCAVKRPSAAGLTVPAPARVIRKPAPNQLGVRVIRAAVANQRLRRPKRLRAVLPSDACRAAHRSARPDPPAPAGVADWCPLIVRSSVEANDSGLTRLPVCRSWSRQRPGPCIVLTGPRRAMRRLPPERPCRVGPTLSAVTRDSPKTAWQAVRSASPRSTLSARRQTPPLNSRLTGVRLTRSDAAS